MFCNLEGLIYREWYLEKLWANIYFMGFDTVLLLRQACFMTSKLESEPVGVL